MNADNRGVTTAITGALFFITVAAFLRPPLLPEMGRELALSSLGLGALGSVFALGRLGADVPAGRISDRMAPGLMMAMSASIVAVGSMMLALSPTSPLAFVSVFVLGAGSALTLTTAQAYFATASRARRGVAMSVFAGGLLTGQAIGPVLGGAIGSFGGWRMAIGFGAVIALASALPFIWIRGEAARSSFSHHAADGGGGGDDVARRILAFIYLLPAVQFAIGAAMVQTLVPIVADEDLGLTVGFVGTALGVGGVARLVAAIGAGRVMDRVGRRAALLPGLVLQLAGLILFGFFGSLWAWWLSIVLVSLGSVSVNVGTAVLADLSEGGRLGPRLGAFRFTGDAAFLVTPVLAGWLLDLSGRAVATAPLMLLTAVVLVGCFLYIPETRTAP